MQPKIYEVWAIRKLNVKELYQVIADNDKPETLIKAIIEDKIPPVDCSQVTLGYDNSIPPKVDKIELFDRRLHMLRSRGIRATNQRLNQIKLDAKEKETK